MRRLLPYPLLWLGLLAMWLLLAGSVSPGQVLVGVIVASLACWAAVALEPPKPKIRRIGVIIQLVGLVIADVLRSNIAVIWLALSRRAPQSSFVTIPLELKEPNGLAVLACIVTATPGSAWIHYDSLHSTVMIHILDTPDDAAWVETLKRHYEQRLMEIFQ